ncbi:CCA tRNA nucleotidyltransferase [Sporosarcina sp. Te-1]|uniref:CCA tRNA nucleotidyltransferase n=1 Tax=Sporosarcina sp. Te-1 TaxID=2818390 RepID=UPI001A9DBA9B|nr:CCA tRNA nucleotidyltransferase [Sporosarcina sp. Te-1]QTD42161.1 CCA tRNA nucleotidyltransferase [Sporosarcina sp. Te-1]
MSYSFGTTASRGVVSKLLSAGYEAVFVGGAVRDLLLGKEASDIDIATSATPAEVKEVFVHTVDVGIQHGTVLVLFEGEPIEVTTYRTEGTYSDHRRPDEVKFVRSLEEDLRRRDFTMNAMALTLDGSLIDPYGGKKDIDNGLIRAVGNAEERFREDALRMFRAIRFSSVLGFSIEESTCRAIDLLANEIRHIAAERLKAEWDKLFLGREPLQAFQYIHETGIGLHLPAYPDELMTACMHRPFQTPMDGWAAFLIAGNLEPAHLARAYKLSNVEKAFLQSIHSAIQIRERRFYTNIDYYRFGERVLLTAESIFNCLHPGKASIEMDEIRGGIAALPIRSKKELAMTGNDLLMWSGEKGGRWVGVWLDKIEQAVILGDCRNERDEIKEWFLHEFERER